MGGAAIARHDVRGRLALAVGESGRLSGLTPFAADECRSNARVPGARSRHSGVAIGESERESSPGGATCHGNALGISLKYM